MHHPNQVVRGAGGQAQRVVAVAVVDRLHATTLYDLTNVVGMLGDDDVGCGVLQEQDGVVGRRGQPERREGVPTPARPQRAVSLDADGLDDAAVVELGSQAQHPGVAEDVRAGECRPVRSNEHRGRRALAPVVEPRTLRAGVRPVVPRGPGQRGEAPEHAEPPGLEQLDLLGVRRRSLLHRRHVGDDRLRMHAREDRTSPRFVGANPRVIRCFGGLSPHATLSHASNHPRRPIAIAALALATTSPLPMPSSHAADVTLSGHSHRLAVGPERTAAQRNWAIYVAPGASPRADRRLVGRRAPGPPLVEERRPRRWLRRAAPVVG